MKLPAISLVLLFVAIGAVAGGTPPGLMPLDGRMAPALKLADMDGKTTDLAQMRGQWVLVHFWASWCGPCRREMPTLQRMREQIPVTDLAMVLINTAENDEEVFSFMGVVAPNLESLLDTDGQVTAKWRPRGLPSSFLVDPEGRLRYIALGGRQWDSPAYLQFLRHLTLERP